MALYFPVSQLPNSFMTYFVRSPLDATALAPQLRGAVAKIDRAVPLAEMGPLDAVVWTSVGRPYFVFVLAAAFATLAALLAGVGLFGVIAESVSLRRRELAVRRALGAQIGDIVRLVFGEGLALVAAGSVLGLLAARGAAVLLQSQLYGTTPGSLDVYAAAAGFTLAVAIAALVVPARRALRADPVKDLRAE
jgi:ABC-type antimicrobial peptide transport system permease subunit